MDDEGCAARLAPEDNGVVYYDDDGVKVGCVPGDVIPKSDKYHTDPETGEPLLNEGLHPIRRAFQFPYLAAIVNGCLSKLRGPNDGRKRFMMWDGDCAFSLEEISITSVGKTVPSEQGRVLASECDPECPDSQTTRPIFHLQSSSGDGILVIGDDGCSKIIDCNTGIVTCYDEDGNPQPNEDCDPQCPDKVLGCVDGRVAFFDPPGVQIEMNDDGSICKRYKDCSGKCILEVYGVHTQSFVGGSTDQAGDVVTGTSGTADFDDYISSVTFPCPFKAQTNPMVFLQHQRPTGSSQNEDTWVEVLGTPTNAGFQIRSNWTGIYQNTAAPTVYYHAIGEEECS